MNYKKITVPNKAYSLWRVNGYKQGFRFVASFGLGGHESASKPPQAICKPLCLTLKDDNDKYEITELV